MQHELLNGADAMTPTLQRTRELAERTCDGKLVRLFWRQGTREVWVEVWEPDLDVTIEITVEPARALEAFHRPYAYAAAHTVVDRTGEPLAAYDSRCPDGV
jgi:hypothetical protein